MHTLYKGAPVTSPRVLALTMTHVHPDTQAHHVASVVLLDVPRALDKHYRIIGTAALDQLAAQGLPIGNTDPLTYGRRYGYPKHDYSAHRVALTNTDDNTTRHDYSETYRHGGGTRPEHTAYLLDGEPYSLPAVDYTNPIN